MILKDHTGKTLLELPGDTLDRADLRNKDLKGVVIDRDVSRADFSGADLTGASFGVDTQLNACFFTAAKLGEVLFHDVTLRHCNFRGAKARGLGLIRVSLDYADFTQADLTGARLTRVKLAYPDFGRAVLRGVAFAGVDGEEASFKEADLTGARFERCGLTQADLSGCKGLTAPSDWMEENFEATAEGYVVYKRVSPPNTSFRRTTFDWPAHWAQAPGAELTEVVNPNRFDECGCGVNFGTKAWVSLHYYAADVWRCLLPWKHLPSLVVPYNTDGKARCGHLRLVEPVPREEWATWDPSETA